MLPWQVPQQGRNPVKVDHEAFSKTISKLTQSDAFEGGEERLSREASNK